MLMERGIEVRLLCRECADTLDGEGGLRSLAGSSWRGKGRPSTPSTDRIGRRRRALRLALERELFKATRKVNIEHV